MAIDPKLFKQLEQKVNDVGDEQTTAQDLLNISDTDDRDISVASQETKTHSSQ